MELSDSPTMSLTEAACPFGLFGKTTSSPVTGARPSAQLPVLLQVLNRVPPAVQVTVESTVRPSNCSTARRDAGWCDRVRTGLLPRAKPRSQDAKVMTESPSFESWPAIQLKSRVPGAQTGRSGAV